MRLHHHGCRSECNVGRLSIFGEKKIVTIIVVITGLVGVDLVGSDSSTSDSSSFGSSKVINLGKTSPQLGNYH